MPFVPSEGLAAGSREDQSEGLDAPTYGENTGMSPASSLLGYAPSSGGHGFRFREWNTRPIGGAYDDVQGESGREDPDGRWERSGSYCRNGPQPGAENQSV
ncbi:hypothetical protein CERSUDRAFT_80612, partial [Gelatoporia subvermispora B]